MLISKPAHVGHAFIFFRSVWMLGHQLLFTTTNRGAFFAVYSSATSPTLTLQESAITLVFHVIFHSSDM